MNLKSKLIIGFLIMLTAVFLSACSLTTIEVKGRIWKIQEPPNNTVRSFPELEQDLMPERLTKVYSEGVKTRKTNGLVFSGGGTRSATLTLGQLRALNELGILEEIHYISAISGGSWAVVPFIYAKCGKNDECGEVKYTESARFLGRYIPPNELTIADLKDDKNMGSLGKAITESGALGKMISAWLTFKGDETFSYVIGSIFLEPFNLNENKFFTSNNKTRKSILADNNEFLDKESFYITENDKPFLIVNSTVQLKHNTVSKRKPYEIFPLEMTPLYVGVPTEKTALGKESRRVGGGYIEPFMYNSKPPSKAEDIFLGDKRNTTVSIQNSLNRFSLSDVIATSGAAPQAMLSGGLKYLFFLPSNFGFPELHHWPVTDPLNYRPDKEDFIHGDGGNIDNIGLMPLLARQVDNILVFVNTKEDFDTGYSDGGIPSYAMYSDLQDYFKYNKNRPKNVIFEERELNVLYKALEKDKQAGRPLVHCDKYTIKENKFFGVIGVQSYKPTICWFYNDKPKKWVKLIGSSSLEKERDKILNEKPPYKNIPHSRTFLQQWHSLKLIDRNKRHVNIESNISSWAVCESVSEVFGQQVNIKINKKKDTKCAPDIK